MASWTRWVWAALAGYFFIAGHVGLGLMPLTVQQMPAILAALRPSLDTTVLLSVGPLWLVVPPLRFVMHIAYYEFARAFGGWARRWLWSRRMGRWTLRLAVRLSLAVSCVWPNSALDIALGVAKAERPLAYASLASGVTISTAIVMVVSTRFGPELQTFVQTIAGNAVAVTVLCTIAAFTMSFALYRLVRSVRATAGDDGGD
ncbi:hypothetical protein [Agromyces sp. M3QZ16-3]|uniref:hypothetical protein n=1 Tax=Agromyces sp. M3QZ16-3 TaxID=3447585 RepID=UPI003F68F7BF